MVVVRVAAVQHDIVWEDPAANHERLRPVVEAAAGGGAEIVVLSEMWSTGFSMNADVIAQAPDGPTPTFMLDTARELGVWLAGSFPERTVGHPLPTNRFLLAGPGGEDHRYSKIRPFSFAGEDQHYAAGRETITVEVGGLRITPFVCYDLRFADLFWDAAARTDCYLVPANWPAARSEHWTSLLRARAIENQAWVIGVNRVGDGDGLAYSGDTRIIAPLGAITAATPGEVETIIVDVDPAMVADTRARFPFMQDR